MTIGDFFGGIFKWIGIFIKLVTVMGALALGCVLLLLNRQLEAQDYGLAALLVLVPYQIGRVFSHIGKRLQATVTPEVLPGGFMRESRQARWGNEPPVPSAAPAPKPASVQPVPRRPPRIAAPEVDVETAPEPTPAPRKKAVLWGGQQQADVTAMGVGELYDPDKKE